MPCLNAAPSTVSSSSTTISMSTGSKRTLCSFSSPMTRPINSSNAEHSPTPDELYDALWSAILHIQSSRVKAESEFPLMLGFKIRVQNGSKIPPMKEFGGVGKKEEQPGYPAAPPPERHGLIGP